MRKRGWTLDVLVGSVCLAVVLATGCEDEGGKKAPSELAAAVANAGSDQQVGCAPLGRTVTGQGTYTDPSTVIALTGGDLTVHAFIGGVCIFDTSGTSYPITGNDATSVTVTGDASSETAGDGVDIHAPVTLDGSASHAAGTEDDPEGTKPASFEWVQDGGDATQVTLSDATDDKPTFIPLVVGSYNFTLTVDGMTDTVKVKVVAIAVSIPEVWVGGYGKAATIAATVSPADVTYSYRWTQSGGAPFPAEWNPVDVTLPSLAVTSPLITDLKILPDDFRILPIGGLSIARATGSRLRIVCTVYDETPTTRTVQSYSYDSSAGDDGETQITFTAGGLGAVDAHKDEYAIFDTVAHIYKIIASDDDSVTVEGDVSDEPAGDDVDISVVCVTSPRQELRAVGPTTGGNVVPVGAPVFIAGGGKIPDPDTEDVLLDVTSWVWAGSADLTQPDGTTTLSNTDQVATLVPEGPGDYYVLCTRTGSGVTDTKAVRIRAATYVGVGSIAGRTPDPDKGECAACHRGQYDNIGDQTTDWEKSAHAGIFKFGFVKHDGTGKYKYDDFRDNSCIPCHVVGYDESASADNGGFDDVATDAGANASIFYESTPPDYNGFVKAYPTVADKSGIQCENCHGPGSTHSGDTGGTGVAALAGMCGPCHDDHGVEMRQWERSVHTGVDVSHGTRDGCVKCHAGGGLARYLRDGTDTGLLAEQVGEKSCGTCHDTHHLTNNTEPVYFELNEATGRWDEFSNPKRKMLLRAEGEVELPNGVKFDFGHSAVCANCHNGRRDTRDIEALVPSMPHHGSQQAMMLAGTGAFEYELYDYVDGPHTAGTAAKPSPVHCNDCHMASKVAHLKTSHGELADSPSNVIGMHTWRMQFGTTGTLADDGDGFANPRTLAGTREFRVDVGGPFSFVGLVEAGDKITLAGPDAVTGAPIAAVMSRYSLLIADPAPLTPTLFTGGAVTGWSIDRTALELVEGCQNCHTGNWPADSFDQIPAAAATGKDWDGRGGSLPALERIQNLCDDLLAEINTELTAKVGRDVTLVDYRKGRYNDGDHDFDFPSYGKKNKDCEVQSQDTVTGNGVYTAASDTTVLTLGTGNLTPGDHVGDVCIFVDANRQYGIVANDADTLTVDGDASEELTDDTVSIATKTPSTWDDEWESIYKATYNYFFVLQDHSGGMHNPGYAVGLLRSSLEDLGVNVGGDPYTAP